MSRQWIAAIALLALLSCSREAEHAHETRGAGHSHEKAHSHEETPRGSHGGRMLSEGDFAIELAIYETGVPPEFRAWAYQNGKPVSPADVQLQVQLARLGGVVEQIHFTPQREYLRGDREIVEPHSFDVQVTAQHKGSTHRWSYESYEGRTSIEPEAAAAAGIETATAGPGTIKETLTLYGSIVPDITRVREVRARFPGVIRAVKKRPGDTVKAGETLAEVESNESLQVYSVTSPISGVITQRHAEAGEQTSDTPLFEVADFSSVWAELRVFPRDRPRIRTGQRVIVRADGGSAQENKIAFVAPLGNPNSQSVIARVVLDNSSHAWTPGQFAQASVVVEETPVDLVVPLSALQTFRDFDVVFAQFGDTYEVRMVELGRRDSENVEVLGGLAPGTRIVTKNSFLIKADIEKSGASHDH